ncbi:MAG: dihydropteroate synthase [Pseudomonadota bacterium]
MLREIYLRPVGLYPGRLGETADEVWGGLRLAGGWLDFTAIEVIERNGAHIERRVAGLGDFLERDWGRRTLAAADMFELVRKPRPRICGLSLDRPRIMGIVNVTPDSFSDGGCYEDAASAIDHAWTLIDAGADVIDIGGESTRPGSDPVELDTELKRVMPVIEGLAGKTDALISIDTRKAEVMRAAVAAGADMINDVSALMHDPAALETTSELGVPVILMHAKGDPKTMQDAPTYDHVQLEVFDFLEARIAACVAAGLPAAKLIADPGIGFGKTLEHNLSLIAGMSLLHGLGVPILLGASRKRFVGALTGIETASNRVSGSVGAALAGVAQGAQFVRVHDVAETREALTVWQAATLGSPAHAS